MHGEPPYLSFPIGPLKIDWLSHGRIPTPANYEEFRKGPSHIENGLREAVKQYNVAIHIAKAIVCGNLLCAGENRRKQGRAKLVARDLRFIAQLKSPGGFARARLVTKENDFTFWVQLAPTAYGIPLNQAVMALESFGDGKNGQHSSGHLAGAMRLRAVGAFNSIQLADSNLGGDV